jgi:glutaconate CoA-transferase subunit B
MNGYTLNELLITAISKEVKDQEVSAVGTLSPIPAAACLLAKETIAPNAEIFVAGSRNWPLGDYFEELFNMAQRGEIDLFFLSGAQIDQFANINLTVIGDFKKPRIRLPGGAGSAMLYYEARRTVLFTLKHSRMSLVEKVDFVTTPGLTQGVYGRRGRPTKLFTPLAVFNFDLEKNKFQLMTIHSGNSLDSVINETGFKIEPPRPLLETDPPTSEELHLIRTNVKNRLKDIYPEFARNM